MYKIVDESIFSFSKVYLSKILSGSSLHFVGIRVSHFAIGMSHEFQSPVTKLG